MRGCFGVNGWYLGMDVEEDEVDVEGGGSVGGDGSWWLRFGFFFLTARQVCYTIITEREGKPK